MSTIYKCDICGKEMERIEGKASLRLNETKVELAASQAFTYAEKDMSFDLCENCYNNLEAYLSWEETKHKNANK